MQRHKSQRHVNAANARWRAASWRADAEREAGNPDRVDTDCRAAFDLPLAAVGGADYRLEPRLGYVAWRAIDTATGKVVHCAALKELLHKIADGLPRMLATRNWQ